MTSNRDLKVPLKIRETGDLKLSRWSLEDQKFNKQFHREIKIRLDWGSIRLSPRYSSSPSTRLTVEQLWELGLGTALWIRTHFGSYPSKCRGGPARCTDGPARCTDGPAKCRGDPARCRGGPAKSKCRSGPAKCWGTPLSVWWRSVRVAQPSIRMAQPSVGVAQPSSTVIGGLPSRLYAWPSRLYGGVVAHKPYSVNPSPFWF